MSKRRMDEMMVGEGRWRQRRSGKQIE